MGFIDGTHYTESEIEAMGDDLIKSLLGFDAEDQPQQSSFYGGESTTTTTTTTTTLNSKNKTPISEPTTSSLLNNNNNNNDQNNNYVLVNNQNVVNSTAVRKGKELSPLPPNLIIDQTAIETLKSSYDSVVGFVLSHTTGVVINCPQCKHMTSHKQDMIDHINSKHIRYPAFECKSCQEKYFSKRKLKEHTKRKHETSPTKNSNKRKLEQPQPQPQPQPQQAQIQPQPQLQNQTQPSPPPQQELLSQLKEENVEEKRLKIEEQEVKEEIKPSTSKEDDKKQKIKLICPVCLSVPSKYASTLCGHVFCEPCIRKVAESLKSCPLCQKSLDSKSYHPLYLSF